MTKRQDGKKQDEPLPREPQNLQAADDEGEDPLAIPVPEVPGEDDELPDTDEAGTHPKGRPRGHNVHPEHPAPDEPTG